MKTMPPHVQVPPLTTASQTAGEVSRITSKYGDLSQKYHQVTFWLKCPAWKLEHRWFSRKQTPDMFNMYPNGKLEPDMFSNHVAKKIGVPNRWFSNTSNAKLSSKPALITERVAPAQFKIAHTAVILAILGDLKQHFIRVINLNHN